jgi:MFS family permease
VTNTWGFIGTFGVFQSYYATSLGRPPADISWIGSFQIFLLFFIGTLTGRLTDAGFFRAVFFVGTILQLLGIFSSSFAGESYWQLFMAQGVCMGLGNGFLFCPSMAIVSTYFSKKRALAIGIVACGSATGGLVFPSVARQLLPTVGFAWTMRTIGFLQLATLVVCNIFFKPRLPPRRSGAWLDLAAFKEWEYTFYVLGSFAVSINCHHCRHAARGNC